MQIIIIMMQKNMFIKSHLIKTNFFNKPNLRLTNKINGKKKIIILIYSTLFKFIHAKI